MIYAHHSRQRALEEAARRGFEQNEKNPVSGESETYARLLRAIERERESYIELVYVVKINEIN